MRKVLKEIQWKVSLTTGGSQAQTLEKNVEAPTQDAAVRRAMQAFPGMNFIQVMATSLEPQATPAGTQQPIQPQQQLPRQMVALRGLQGLMQPGQQQGQQQQTEGIDPNRFSYPYAITLPVHFSRILAEASPVEVNSSHGQYRIVLKTHQQMREFVERLGNNRNRDAATAIINGIRSSLNE